MRMKRYLGLVLLITIAMMAMPTANHSGKTVSAQGEKIKVYTSWPLSGGTQAAVWWNTGRW